MYIFRDNGKRNKFILWNKNWLEEVQVGVTVERKNGYLFSNFDDIKVPSNGDTDKVDVASIFNELGKMRNLTK